MTAPKLPDNAEYVRVLKTMRSENYDWRCSVSRCQAIDELRAVLCDHDGKCCIAGSVGDRRVVDEALATLAQHIEQVEAERDDAMVEHKFISEAYGKAEAENVRLREAYERILAREAVADALRPTGDNAEHVRVLEKILSYWGQFGVLTDAERDERAALTAAIAALSQPSVAVENRE